MKTYVHFCRLIVAISCVLMACQSQAQTVVSGPLTGANTLGEYINYNTGSIILGPGFTSSPGSGQSFHAHIVSLDCATYSLNLTTTQNYILTSVPRIAAFDPSSTSYGTCDVIRTVQYIDGLGRPLQTVQIKGSTNLQDVVQPYAYDQYGREAIKYLPYADPGTADGSFKAGAVTAQAAFYASPPTGVTYNLYPSTSTGFEPSPLDRPVEQGAPGTAWQLSTSGISGSGHTVGLGYGVNVSGEVTLWSVTTGGATGTGSYSANTLYKTTTTDENGHSSIEYKDMQGRVVCKKDASGNATNYVYDDLGNLAYVIPPIPAGVTYPTSFAETDAVFLNYMYGYHYDRRNRLIEKKVPGKGWEFMIYNPSDQVSFSQDAAQRAKSQQEWTFTRYDAQGRVAITGIWTSGPGIPGYTGDSSVGSPGHSLEAWLQSWSDAHYPHWATRDNTTATGYNNDDPPGQILTINYYDDYTNPDIPYYPWSSGTMTTPTGLPTATRTTIMNPDGTYGNELWTVYYYDDKGRLVQTFNQHYLGGAGSYSINNYNTTQTFYNFTNEVTNSNEYHFTAASTTVPAITNQRAYYYDHMGRKTDTWEAIIVGSGTPPASTLISRNAYNETGQLLTKNLHSGNSGASFLQTQNYTYNERGWLKTSSAPLFAMQLNYNDGTTPQYNGNITNQQWGTPGSLSKSYTYSYDALNRLTTGTGSTGNTENNITYDDMGNITQLYRYLNSTQVDQLTYSYSSTNQLQSITDATSNDAGLKHGTFSYAYDINGNMITDNSKGLTVTYNMLNLPAINTITGGTISYTYDATGKKLRKVSTLGSGTTTEYIDGIQYTGSTIDFIQTEEGRALNSGGTYHYEYNLTDHLGNTRLSFDTNSGVTNITQQDDYLPFGMEVSVGTIVSPKNEYLYNKKELQEELGQYDYGARFYDPVIGRWTSVDPLAEKMRKFTPYSYAFDNPISFIDKDGFIPMPVQKFFNNLTHHISSWFGARNTGLSYASTVHEGLDINFGSGSQDYGAPVMTTHDGKVSIKDDPEGNNGRMVTVTSPDGTFRTKYMHLSKITVSAGQEVNEKDVVGEIGGSGGGSETGRQVHLHYQIEKYDPKKKTWSPYDPTEGKGKNEKNVVDPQLWINGGSQDSDKNQDNKTDNSGIIRLLESYIKTLKDPDAIKNAQGTLNTIKNW